MGANQDRERCRLSYAFGLFFILYGLYYATTRFLELDFGNWTLYIRGELSRYYNYTNGNGCDCIISRKVDGTPATCRN